MKKTTAAIHGIPVRIIAILLFAIYLAITVGFGAYLYNIKTSSASSHADRMDASVTSVDYTEGDYTEVAVGMYIDALRNISIADSSFEAVFYLWFTWEGDPAFSPGDSFQMVGGFIDDKELVSEHYNEDGTNYQRYKVTATFDKYYDLTRVSLEDHMLNIYIEDTTRDSSRLRYVADEAQTAISSRVSIPGFENSDVVQSVVKPHEYKSTYSSPSANGNRVFSQYIVGVEIERSDAGFYLKVAVPFILSVMLGLMALWSHRTGADALGLSGASFFGVIANAYIVTSFVPSNGGSFGVMDVVNFGSLLTVLLIVCVSIVSLTIRNEEEQSDTAMTLDRSCFVALAAGYAMFNIVIPLCASSISLF